MYCRSNKSIHFCISHMPLLPLHTLKVSWSTLSPYRLVTTGADGLARTWDVREACLKRYGHMIGNRLEYCLRVNGKDVLSGILVDSDLLSLFEKRVMTQGMATSRRILLNRHLYPLFQLHRCHQLLATYQIRPQRTQTISMPMAFSLQMM